jgi:hypothetical protein
MSVTESRGESAGNHCESGSDLPLHRGWGLKPAFTRFLLAARRGWEILAPAVGCDKPLWALLVLYAALWVPLIPRQTDNPQMLASLINDEPLLTQDLVAMTYWPYGNPANFDLANSRRHPLPSYWGTITYKRATYYGGTYLGTAFLLYLPFKACQFDDFPVAPMVLRTVSVLAGLLSLMVLYNLGKRLSGRTTGFLAGLIFLADSGFGYYSSIIHPDTSMLALSLLALWAAIRHAETGSGAALIVTGVLIGFAQGAKMAGPWLVPMATLAAAWGVWTTADPEARRAVLVRSFIRRFCLLGFVALGAWVLSTPYAFFDHHYFNTVKMAWRAYRNAPFGDVNAYTWLLAVWNHEGTVMGVLALAGLALVPWRRWRGQHSALLVLAATLGLSIILFHAVTVKLWIVVGYLLPGLALIGLFAADFLTRAVRGLSGVSRWLAGGTALAGAYFVLPVLYLRLLGVLTQALTYHCVECNTTLYINRWAQAHLSPESKILFDDIAYLDPKVFSNTKMHCNFLTYDDLARAKPDYFILSGSIYDSPHFQQLRKTQTYSLGQEGPVSVLLYQDLIDRNGCPEAVPVGTISSTLPPGRTALDNAIGLARLALGLDDYLIGTEVRVYRYRPPAHVREKHLPGPR